MSQQLDAQGEAHQALGTVGLTILLNNLGLLLGYRERMLPVAAGAFNSLHTSTGKPTMLEISTMLDSMGADGARAVFFCYSAKYGDALAQDWPDEDVAPFVAAHLDLVTEGLTATNDDFYFRSAPGSGRRASRRRRPGRRRHSRSAGAGASTSSPTAPSPQPVSTRPAPWS